MRPLRAWARSAGCITQSAGQHRDVSYHSPVWFQKFNWNRKDLTGASHAHELSDGSASGGLTGSRRCRRKSTRIGVDARWFNYANTAGFSKVGYNADGSVAGFGWRNIWAVGGGVQQKVGAVDQVHARL